MTDSTEAITGTSLAPAPATEVAHRNTRLYQVLAWVGIVAASRSSSGRSLSPGSLHGRQGPQTAGWHRGAQSGQMVATRRPDGRRLPDDADAAWRHGTRRHDARDDARGTWDRAV